MRTYFSIFVVALLAACSSASTGPDTPPKILPLASIYILPTSPVMVEGSVLQLGIGGKAADSSGVAVTTPVVWTSATPSVATISSTGVVTSGAQGTSVITATSGNFTATATLTVQFSPCNATGAVTIVAGQTITGNLTSAACGSLNDNTVFDLYKFVVLVPTTIDLKMRSRAFNAYLWLYMVNISGGLTRVAENDDIDATTTDAELAGFVAAGTYYVLANNTPGSGLGAYTLQLVSPAVAGVSSMNALTLMPLGTSALRRVSNNPFVVVRPR